MEATLPSNSFSFYVNHPTQKVITRTELAVSVIAIAALAAVATMYVLQWPMEFPDYSIYVAAGGALLLLGASGAHYLIARNEYHRKKRQEVSRQVAEKKNPPPPVPVSILKTDDKDSRSEPHRTASVHFENATLPPGSIDIATPHNSEADSSSSDPLPQDTPAPSPVEERSDEAEESSSSSRHATIENLPPPGVPATSASSSEEEEPDQPLLPDDLDKWKDNPHFLGSITPFQAKAAFDMKIAQGAVETVYFEHQGGIHCLDVEATEHLKVKKEGDLWVPKNRDGSDFIPPQARFADFSVRNDFNTDITTHEAARELVGAPVENHKEIFGILYMCEGRLYCCKKNQHHSDRIDVYEVRKDPMGTWSLYLDQKWIAQMEARLVRQKSANLLRQTSFGGHNFTKY